MTCGAGSAAELVSSASGLDGVRVSRRVTQGAETISSIRQI